MECLLEILRLLKVIRHNDHAFQAVEFTISRCSDDPINCRK
jgi:hypothetical protein